MVKKVQRSAGSASGSSEGSGNAKLAGTLSLIIHDADMSKRLVDMGFVPGGSSQQDFTARIQREYDIWKTIVRERNITIND